MLFGCCRCFENKLVEGSNRIHVHVFSFPRFDPKDKNPWRDLANLSLTYKINHPREYPGYAPGNTPGTPQGIPRVRPREYPGYNPGNTPGYTPGIPEVSPGKQPENHLILCTHASSPNELIFIWRP
jgi:hypothetical protein